MILVCWEEEKKNETWRLEVLAIAESKSYLQIIAVLRGERAPWSHYNRQLMVMGRGGTHGGIERATLHWGGTSRTDGGQETSWWEALFVIKAGSVAAVRAAYPETNGGPKGPTPNAKTAVCICTAESSAHGPLGQAEYHLLCGSSLSLYSFWLGLMLLLLLF